MRVVTIVSLKLVLHPILPHAVSIWGVGVGGGSFGGVFSFFLSYRGVPGVRSMGPVVSN